jgi:hypothetical protein
MKAFCVAWAVVLLAAAGPAFAQEARLANGVVLKGDVKRATGAGLEIATPQGSKIIPWNNLSRATRYRYEVKYRSNFQAVLDGKPAGDRKSPPYAEYKPPFKS